MAKKNLLVHLDMNKQELQNAKAHNLTTAQIVTLAGTLLAGDKGLFVYDTTLNKLFVWSGTAFENVTPAPPTIGQYRGAVANTDAEPANLVSGDWVVFNSAGALTNFVPGAVVEIEDKAFYNGTTWDLVQGNVVMATETVAGIVQFATNAEVIAGTDNTKAMTITKTILAAQRVFNDNFDEVTFVVTANTPVVFARNGAQLQDVKFFIGTPTTTLTPVELDWYDDVANGNLVFESNIDIPNLVLRYFTKN